MTTETFQLGYQFFCAVLKDKGVDQPTIDFVWKHGESLYLWQQNFGNLTKAQLQQMGEVAWELKAKPSELPPIEIDKATMTGIIRFDEVSFWRGEMTFYYQGKQVMQLHPHTSGWFPDSVTRLVGINGTTGFKIETE